MRMIHILMIILLVLLKFFDVVESIQETPILTKTLSGYEVSNGKSILFLKFIVKNLALIAVINEENYERNNLLDYNINVFRQAVKSILKIK